MLPGKYNERAFKGLDHVLDSAGRNGIRVILTIADNWPSNMTLKGTADSKQTVSAFATSGLARGLVKTVGFYI